MNAGRATDASSDLPERGGTLISNRRTATGLNLGEFMADRKKRRGRYTVLSGIDDIECLDGKRRKGLADAVDQFALGHQDCSTPSRSCWSASTGSR